jgi:hypothetical protein
VLLPEKRGACWSNLKTVADGDDTMLDVEEVSFDVAGWYDEL